MDKLAYNDALQVPERAADKPSEVAVLVAEIAERLDELRNLNAFKAIDLLRVLGACARHPHAAEALEELLPWLAGTWHVETYAERASRRGETRQCMEQRSQRGLEVLRIVSPGAYRAIREMRQLQARLEK